jgi:hypothetical protein
MHYSNFIKSGNKLALDPTVVISGGATTTTVYESEAAADINELREQNEAMKSMLNETNEFDEIDEAIKNADIMSTGVLDNISNLESGFKTAVKDVVTKYDKYPDMDPDNIELPEAEADTDEAGEVDTEDAGEASESTEAPEAAEATETPSATLTLSPSTNKWDVVTSTDNTPLTASSIDTNSLVSKIINGGNGRVVSSVPIEQAPETNHNPFENNERDMNETTEAKPVEKPDPKTTETTETKVEEKPAKEHPLVALFKNPEDIYRITTVLEHAKALAEAENPANGTVNLSQEEMEFVMGLLMDLGEKYFPDIPLVDTPDYWFIANIPVEMYNAILSWYNQTDVPDILNPVVTLYISMCEEPELAYGRYLKIRRGYIYDNAILVNKLDAEYKHAKHLDDDEEAEAEDDLIETDDEDEEGDE